MKRLVSLLVLVLFAASACSYGGTPVEPAALTMNGTVVVTMADLEDELTYLEENPEIAGALLTDPLTGAPLPLEGEIVGAWSPAAAATLLNLHAQVTLLETVAADQGVTPDEDALATARDGLAEQLDGMGLAIDDLPVGIVDALVAGSAANQAVGQWLADNPVEAPEITDADVQAFFDENRDRLPEEVACVRHILVAFETDATAETGQPAEPTEEQDAAAADEIASVTERLAAGEDFGDVAGEVSDDPGSGALGGDLGCGDPAQYVAEFADAVADQPLDEVGEPVRTEFGYHLIEVTYRGEPTAELFEDEIRSQLESQGTVDDNTRFGELIVAAAEEVDVKVDPRFGSWDPAGGGIVPPEGAASPPSTASSDLPIGLELP